MKKDGYEKEYFFLKPDRLNFFEKLFVLYKRLNNDKILQMITAKNILKLFGDIKKYGNKILILNI